MMFGQTKMQGSAKTNPCNALCGTKESATTQGASYGNNQCAKLTISKGGRGRQIAQLISCKIDRERGSGNQEMRKEGRNRIASRRMLLCRMNNDHR
ncbi:unnamed protein product [Notodromas monacha]|uniref:Uncharacterized protein n=1 Tax=Notodromas monacha TaxID=399045 RepID=A0A7R9BV53_9CRUS|nr:unnamed protein product [Notodromas monacha]CAG0921205.1 unnamed protein product [Notodromas monacha]